MSVLDTFRNPPLEGDGINALSLGQPLVGGKNADVGGNNAYFNDLVLPPNSFEGNSIIDGSVDFTQLTANATNQIVATFTGAPQTVINSGPLTNTPIAATGVFRGTRQLLVTVQFNYSATNAGATVQCFLLFDATQLGLYATSFSTGAASNNGVNFTAIVTQIQNPGPPGPPPHTITLALQVSAGSITLNPLGLSAQMFVMELS